MKQFYKDAFGWGFILWLIGYVLGIILFAVVPLSMIGWIITPIGTAIAFWVLYKKINNESLRHYILLGTAWIVIAVICDYLFLVKLFKPADGYYKIDVYLYYILTFTIPCIVGWFKQKSSHVK